LRHSGSDYNTEREVLLPRNLKYRVQRIDEVPMRFRDEAEPHMVKLYVLARED
jgi:hypothetical protein